MTHNDYQGQISQLIDGELGKDEQRVLFLHISECDECREFFNAALTLRSNITASSPVGLPAEFDLRMENAAADELMNAPPDVQTAGSGWFAFAGRKLSLSLPLVAIILVMTISGSVLLTSLLQKPEIQKEPVYIMSMPTVEVQGYYSPANGSAQ